MKSGVKSLDPLNIVSDGIFTADGRLIDNHQHIAVIGTLVQTAISSQLVNVGVQWRPVGAMNVVQISVEPIIRPCLESGRLSIWSRFLPLKGRCQAPGLGIEMFRSQ
jgi:hypothetical protein